MIQGVQAVKLENTRFTDSGKQQASTSCLPSSIKTVEKTNINKLVGAYHGLYGINPAKTVAFGQSLQKVISTIKSNMVTCRDEDEGKDGETVGEKFAVSTIVNQFYDDLPNYNDAIKTDVQISKSDKSEVIARTQLKKMRDGVLCEMAVRQPKGFDEETDLTKDLYQRIKITQTQNIPEKSYIFNTKGKLMVAVEDEDKVILTNSGKFTKKDNKDGTENFSVDVWHSEHNFKPFNQPMIHAVKREPKESIGEGTEIVIGMEASRFVPEIINSIENFIKKVDRGEIVLEQFVASPNAKNTQLTMLAGGFGSRAEYANASSSGIFHNRTNGAQSTKGTFITPTGLTPMETTFITLHKAGLLDCSKGKLKIGGNIKLYLNKSGINKGNGGFTVDLYNRMDREGRESITIFPNDSMSRMTEATKKMEEKMNSGNAAIVMIAKKVKSQDAINNFGIMKLNDKNEILEFAEKPASIPAGYEIEKGKCLTNTFQFAVSKDVFKALAVIERYLPPIEWGKETRDWSKILTPVIMAITQNSDLEKMQKDIKEKMSKEFKNKEVKEIPIEKLREAKDILGNKKVYAIPTDEPWADCGNLNQLYYTSMEIVSGQFPLEDFERENAMKCINTKTGLVTTSVEDKEFIENKYNVEGEVFVTKQAPKIPKRLVSDYINKGLITVNNYQL